MLYGFLLCAAYVPCVEGYVLLCDGYVLLCDGYVPGVLDALQHNCHNPSSRQEPSNISNMAF